MPATLPKPLANPNGPTKASSAAATARIAIQARVERTGEKPQQRARGEGAAHRGQRQAPQRGDRQRPGQPGEAVGEEDPCEEDAEGREAAETLARPGEEGPGGRQGDREGEHEQGLGRLLEGGLREVGRGEVGDRDQGRRQHRPYAPHPAQGSQRGQPGEDGDRLQLADERLAEADPRDDRCRDRDPVRAEGVAGIGAWPEPASQPLAPGEVEPEVVVEADPDQPPATADREGNRDDQRQHQGDGRAGGQGAVEAVGDPQPGQAEGAEHEQADRRRRPVTGQPDQQPGNRDHRGEPDRRLQPGPALAAARRQDRAADQKRGGADQRRRGVGPDHERGNYGSAPVEAARLRAAALTSSLCGGAESTRRLDSRPQILDSCF